MSNRLYKYNGFDDTTNSIISGYTYNDAYIFGEESTYSGSTEYTDITSINNLDKIGELVGLNHFEVREEIKNLYNTDGVDWVDYTLETKKTLSRYFIVNKIQRDEVYTDEEQEVFNHYVIYHFISEDVIERMGNNINYKTTPKSIDYKKDLNIRLHPDFTFNNLGFLTEVIYYENLVVTPNAIGSADFVFSNPIVKYTAEYTTGGDGYVQSRLIKRYWMMMDGTFGGNYKESFKIYDPISSREEAKRRRKNLVNNLLVNVVGLLLMTTPELTVVTEAEADAMGFMRDIESAITAYYESGNTLDANGNPCQLIQLISVHTYARLDNYVPGTGNTVTIRMYIMGSLSPE
jgi:hypothetical protein